MNRIKALAAVLLLAGSLVSPAFAGETPLKVVASQAIYADIAKEIGGDKVEAKYIASPKFNVHFFQPKPSDVRNVSKADFVIYTGMDLESWWEPLLEAAGKSDFFPGRSRSIDLSHGIKILKAPDHNHPLSRAEGDIHVFGNPHYIMNPENAKIAAWTIADKLEEIDPSNAEFYEKNKEAFGKKMDQRIDEWRKQFSPYLGEEIVSHHDDAAYLADFLGFRLEQFLEPKPGISPTPKHLEFLLSYVKERKVRMIILPTYFSKDTAQKIASRVEGVSIVTICQNAGELPGTAGVFDFYDYNFRQILEALNKA